MNKANQFIAAAETIRDFAGEDDDVSDAYVTLCVRRVHMSTKDR